MKKRIIFGIIISLIIIVINSTVFATQVQDIDASSSKILGVIQVIGVVISVVMLIAIGIKYMVGSVEEKAEYKSSLKPYIIGTFVLFTGTMIPNIIFKIMQSI